MMQNHHIKNGVKQRRSSGDILCWKMEQSDWSRKIKEPGFPPIMLFTDSKKTINIFLYQR